MGKAIGIAGMMMARLRHVAAALLLCLPLMPDMAWAQAASPPEPPPSETPAPPPSRPGLIDAIGRWVDQSRDEVTEKLKGAQKSIDNLNAATQGAASATRDAAESLTTLPGARVVAGRVVCATAANGAPDCKAAADELCRSKGHRGGRSVESEAAENCPMQVLLSGRRPQPGDCKTETYVTRAVCQ